MNSLYGLIKLELKSKIGTPQKSTKAIINFIFGLIFGALIYAIYIYGLRATLLSFFIYDQEFLFLVFFIAVLYMVLFFVSLTTIGKSLFLSSDNELLMRFPVKGKEVFLSKMLVVLLTQSIITIFLSLPAFIMYGIITAQGIWYFCSIPLVTLLCIIMPFIFSNLLAIPFARVQAYIRDKFLILLIIYVVVIAGGFALYMTLFEGVMKFLNEEQLNFFSGRILVLLENIAKILIPVKQLANLMIGEKLFSSICIIVCYLALFIWINILLINKLYLKIMLRTIETGTSSFTKPTKFKEGNIFNSIIRREFIDIFRSSNYLFQYLAIACGAPVMIYFCNRLAEYIGSSGIGVGVIPALTMLVMLLFVSIITSFSASSLSREGNNLHTLKIMPVAYKKQITVKFILYMLVVTVSIVLSFFILIFTKYTDWQFGLLMLFSSLGFAVFETAVSIKLDILHPSFSVSGDGEMYNSNSATFISLIIGLAIAFIVGVTCMVLAFFMDLKITFLIILGASVFLAVISILLLYYKVDKHCLQMVDR